MKRNIGKSFFLSQIIASELAVSINKRILVISSQCVNKQS